MDSNKKCIVSKKGATLSGWIMAGILTIGMITLLVAFTNDMNDWFGGVSGAPNNLSIGFTEANATFSKYSDYQDTLQTQMGGEAKWSSVLGFQIGTAWDMIKSMADITWQFVTGKWLSEAVVEKLGLPDQVGLIIRLLFFLSIGLIAIRIMFRIRP